MSSRWSGEQWWSLCSSEFSATHRQPPPSHRGRESLFMGYNETRDVGTLTINFISDCDNDVTLLYLPTATGRSSTSTPLIKPPPLRWMHKFSQPPQVRSACEEARYYMFTKAIRKVFFKCIKFIYIIKIRRHFFLKICKFFLAIDWIILEYNRHQERIPLVLEFFQQTSMM